MTVGFIVIGALMVIAALVVGLFLGSAIGFAVGRRERAVAGLFDGGEEYEDDGEEDVCGCTHHQAFHIRGVHGCNYKDEWDETCGCQHYVQRRPRQRKKPAFDPFGIPLPSPAEPEPEPEQRRARG